MWNVLVEPDQKLEARGREDEIKPSETKGRSLQNWNAGSQLLQYSQRSVRPKIAVLLLSVHPLLDQGLLHLHPTHLTDLPTYLSQAPYNDWSNFSHQDSLSKGR